MAATIQLPTGIDPHVHLREPGGAHKETYLSGTSAALAGGYARVLDMPNNKPPIAELDALAAKERAASRAVCDYGFWWGGTADNAHLLPEAARRCAGMKLYMTHTFGPLLVDDPAALVRLFKSWPAGKPIAVHAEGSATLAAMLLGRLYGKWVHVCHVSETWQIAAIRKAKEQGFNVTCEVTPHHLFLTDEDAKHLGSLGQMRPPLGTREDQQALWDNLDVIDVLATDHAPHTLDEKRGENPPPGVPGLETALPLMLTAVGEGRLSPDKLVDMIHGAPSRLFGIGTSDSHTVVETGVRAEIRGSEMQTLCRWTPFEGMPVTARVLETWLRGARVWGDGRVQVAPGFGTNLTTKTPRHEE